MKPEDVKRYYGSNYKFHKITKMSASTLANWLKWGFVPLNAQYRLEALTNGKLKTQGRDRSGD